MEFQPHAAERGNLFLWPTTALSIGGCSIVKSNFNYMLQISLATCGCIRARRRGAANWSEGELVLMWPSTTFEYDFSQSATNTLYVDIEAHDCLLRVGVLSNGGSVETILQERAEPEIGNLRRIAAGMKDGCSKDAARLRDCMLGFVRNKYKLIEQAHSARVSPIDPRLSRVKEYVHAHLEDRISIHALAEVANLSAGRLMVLFRQQLGVTIRHFVLWARVKAALRAAASGLPIAKAAMLGGFYDAAHFTRSFTTIFGVKPTSLFERKSRRVLVCDGF